MSSGVEQARRLVHDRCQYIVRGRRPAVTLVGSDTKTRVGRCQDFTGGSRAMLWRFSTDTATGMDLSHTGLGENPPLGRHDLFHSFDGLPRRIP